MARRRTKKRTHVAPNKAKMSTPLSTGNGSIRDPKSMVIRIGAGEVGSSVSQLASDVRKVMEPGTASRLRERRANRLRDYVTMCGPLGVTQLLLFSRSESGNVNLRVAAAPRGPTLHFRVERYSLSKDVQRAQRHPKGGGKEYVTPPLLVMNGFNLATDASAKIPKHLESLVTATFQSLFPPVHPQSTPLKSMKRVLLLNREQADGIENSFVLNLRHYAITTKTTGISKALRRLSAADKLVHSKSTKKGGLPNLGKLQDIADYMVGGDDGEGYVTDGATSGSEAETDAEVEVMDTSASRIQSRKTRAVPSASQGRDSRADTQAGGTETAVEKRAVKLIELGPRMKLRLVKVEEGMCQGQIMWHEHVHKSKLEIRELKERWEQRKRDKEARKQQQTENLKRKRAGKAGLSGASEESIGATDEEEDVTDMEGFDVEDHTGLDTSDQ